MRMNAVMVCWSSTRSSLTVTPGANSLHATAAARTVRVSGGGIAANTRFNIDRRNEPLQVIASCPIRSAPARRSYTHSTDSGLSGFFPWMV